MNGAELIAKERQRQIDEEGWTAEHDDEHSNDEIALAATCYAAPEKIYRMVRMISGGNAKKELGVSFVDPWPWHPQWDGRDKHDRIRQLEIAGALCAAEIDRLQRSEESSK